MGSLGSAYSGWWFLVIHCFLYMIPKCFDYTHLSIKTLTHTLRWCIFIYKLCIYTMPIHKSFIKINFLVFWNKNTHTCSSVIFPLSTDSEATALSQLFFFFFFQENIFVPSTAWFNKQTGGGGAQCPETGKWSQLHLAMAGLTKGQSSAHHRRVSCTRTGQASEIWKVLFPLANPFVILQVSA